MPYALIVNEKPAVILKNPRNGSCVAVRGGNYWFQYIKKPA